MKGKPNCSDKEDSVMCKLFVNSSFLLSSITGNNLICENYCLRAITEHVIVISC